MVLLPNTNMTTCKITCILKTTINEMGKSGGKKTFSLTLVLIICESNQTAVFF